MSCMPAYGIFAKKVGKAIRKGCALPADRYHGDRAGSSACPYPPYSSQDNVWYGFRKPKLQFTPDEFASIAKKIADEVSDEW